MAEQVKPKDLLEGDMNQDLHRLVGYVWAEGNGRKEFPTNHFIELIEYFLKKHKDYDIL